MFTLSADRLLLVTTSPALTTVPDEVTVTTSDADFVIPVATSTGTPLSRLGKLNGVMPLFNADGSTSRLSKLPIAEIRTKLDPGTATTETLPSLFVTVSEPVFVTVPPIRLIFLPEATFKLAALTIALGLVTEKTKLLGLPTRAAKSFTPTALKLPPLKPIPVAVVAVNDPPTLRLALVPNTKPDGFIRYRLAVLPVILINPSIIEEFPPETRAKIF